MLAKHALYQLSYGPSGVRSGELSATVTQRPRGLVGPGRLELPTLRLSGVRSNHLSYGPMAARQPGWTPGLAIAHFFALTRTVSASKCESGKRNGDGGAPHLIDVPIGVRPGGTSLERR